MYFYHVDHGIFFVPNDSIERQTFINSGWKPWNGQEVNSQKIDPACDSASDQTAIPQKEAEDTSGAGDNLGAQSSEADVRKPSRPAKFSLGG